MRVIPSAVLLAVLGCGTDPDDFGRCNANITVTVSREVNPEFAWSPPDCRMHLVDVSEDQQAQWLIFSNDSDNRLSSPLRYGGTVPETENTGSTPLHPGFFYTVHLWRVDDQGIERRLVSHRFLHEVE